MSLLALAVTDLCSLLAAFLQSVCYNIWINNLVTHINFRHVQYIAGAYPRGVFTRISSFITAYISFERCLCILLPLKVKFILTKRVTLSVLAFIYISMLSIAAIAYYALELRPIFSATLNTTVISLGFRDGETSKDLEDDYIISLSIFQIVAFVLVVVFTAILIFKMRSKGKWREKSLTSIQAETMSSRDRKVIQMVLLISVTFIICYIPTVCQLCVMYALTNYGVNSVYRNVYVFSWSICTFGDIVCASLNIFFYYRMSSNYASVLDTFLPFSFFKKPGDKKTIATK